MRFVRCELEAPGGRFGMQVSAYLNRQIPIKMLPSQISLQKSPSLRLIALFELSRIALFHYILNLARALAFVSARGINPSFRPAERK